MRLYYTPGTCSLSPHIVAREAGIDLDLVKVDIATHLTEDGDRYTDVNPNGYVPALVLEDGFVLTEGPAIVQYLADLAPEAGLAPAAGTRARYVLQQWLNFVSTELHKGFSPLWHKETPAETRHAAKAHLALRFAYLDRALAQRPFLLDGGFTVADAYAFTILSWAKYMAIDLGRWPNVAAYVERIAARPRVREALGVEGLLPKEADAA